MVARTEYGVIMRKAWLGPAWQQGGQTRISSEALTRMTKHNSNCRGEPVE